MLAKLKNWVLAQGKRLAAAGALAVVLGAAQPAYALRWVCEIESVGGCCETYFCEIYQDDGSYAGVIYGWHCNLC